MDADAPERESTTKQRCTQRVNAANGERQPSVSNQTQEANSGGVKQLQVAFSVLEIDHPLGLEIFISTKPSEVRLAIAEDWSRPVSLSRQSKGAFAVAM